MQLVYLHSGKHSLSVDVMNLGVVDLWYAVTDIESLKEVLRLAAT